MIALRWYNVKINKRPIITKAITSFLTFGLGDIICQTLEKKSTLKKRGNKEI